MKTVGRIVGMLVLILVGASIVWFAYARPAVSGNTAMQEQLVATQNRIDNAELRVKELEANPIIRTETVTQTVEVVKEVEVPVEKVIEVRVPYTVEVSATNIGAQVPMTDTVTSNACRHLEWLQNAISGTTDVSELLAVLDRDFAMDEGGQWSESGYTVRANNLFWTDLTRSNPPDYVIRVRTQGNWGVYAATRDFVIPGPNGGGRHMRICEGVGDLSLKGKSPAIAITTPTAKPVPTDCITDAQIEAITSDADPVAKYNSFFEMEGYKYGKGLAEGDKIGTGFYLGTFPADKIPSTAVNMANGFIWRFTGETVVYGGRWMATCK